MRPSIRTGLSAALLTAVCATAASAQMRTYYHVGSWDAFAGSGTDSKRVCGVGSTNPVDNRSLSIRFDIGGSMVSFQVKKPSWNIPANTPISVAMQIGSDAPWNVQADGQRASRRVDAGSECHAGVRPAVPCRQRHVAHIPSRQ